MSRPRISLLWVVVLAAASAIDGQLDQELQQIPDLLAKVALAKEDGDKDAAHQALAVFSAVAQEHIMQTLVPTVNLAPAPATAPDPVSPAIGPTTATTTGTGTPTADSLGEPSLAYFKDTPTAQTIDDFLGFITNPASSVSIRGPDGINFAPCLVSTQPSGVNIYASAINVVPRLVEVITDGIGIFPFGIAIQPTLAFIHPTGIDIAPTGVSISPSLLTVSGADVAIIPQGFGDASALLQVSGKPPLQGGRRHLQSRTPEQFATVFNESYGAWVGVVSDLAMRKGTSLQGSQSVMEDFIALAQASLKDIVATGSTLINPPSISAGQLIVDNSANVTSHSSLLSIAESFINFNPCLVSISPNGVQIVPSGVLIDPTGILVVPVGLEFKPQGVLILPTLLKVNPAGIVIGPTGVSITPSLLDIFPVLHVLSAPTAASGTHVAHIVSDPADSGR